MGRYVAEQTWNGLGALGENCAFWDAPCHARNAAKAIDKAAGDALDKLSGDKWSESQKMRTAAAEALGLQEKKTAVSKPGTPKTGSSQKKSAFVIPAAPKDKKVDVVIKEETNYTPFIVGGLALVGVLAVLGLKKKKR